MKIGILTSSRADFGIYLPLLRRLQEDSFFDPRLIVFGTHLSPFHGLTVTEIEKGRFVIDARVSTILVSDDPESISSSMALTMDKFSTFWSNHEYDLVFCLGDRYEMFAAVAAAIPFNKTFAHIHAGEVTLGAIDNQFRDAISLFSTFFFTSNTEYSDRLKRVVGTAKNIINVGALSLDNIGQIPLYSISEFTSIYGIDLSDPTILVTFHPETVAPEKNQHYICELCDAIKALSQYNFVVTMPNADTNSFVIRSGFESLSKELSNVKIIENFGTRGYFSCMKHCSLLLGNSSSGIIEAASFNKVVINLGDRQKGRATGSNVFHCPISKTEIVKKVNEVSVLQSVSYENIYWNGGAANEILRFLKSI